MVEYLKDKILLEALWLLTKIVMEEDLKMTMMGNSGGSSSESGGTEEMMMSEEEDEPQKEVIWMI